mmetsp:Transcript_9983/g.22308  ORF Transcript_9983/g.22308 Transcript_9983/m.22308 type:complete len:218 (-) Transcript_9983:1043-1696(-)
MHGGRNSGHLFEGLRLSSEELRLSLIGLSCRRLLASDLQSKFRLHAKHFCSGLHQSSAERLGMGASLRGPRRSLCLQRSFQRQHGGCAGLGSCSASVRFTTSFPELLRFALGLCCCPPCLLCRLPQDSNLAVLQLQLLLGTSGCLLELQDGGLCSGSNLLFIAVSGLFKAKGVAALLELALELALECSEATSELAFSTQLRRSLGCPRLRHLHQMNF